MSMVIFRHGSRQSLLLDKDGNLTNEGKTQEYILGRELKYRYGVKKRLLSNKFDPEQIYAQTSPKARAVESLYWLLSGLY